jgi:hypothetical protein
VGGGNGSLSLPVLRKCKPDVKLIIQGELFERVACPADWAQKIGPKSSS